MTNLPTPSGLLVNILGPDGSGKSTLAKGLIATLTANGLSSTLCRWSDIVNGRLATSEPVRVLLQELYVEAWRALYVGAKDDQSLRLQLAPPSFARFQEAELEQSAPSEPLGATSSGMTASALLEFVADILIAAQVTQPLVRAGQIVVADSYGIKNVGKVLGVAEAIGDDIPSELINFLRGAVVDAYRSPFLTPDAGIVVNVDPEVCLRRRLSQRGRVGPVEDLAFAGEYGDSFLTLQKELLDTYLAHAAQSPVWHVIDATYLSPAELVEHAAALVNSVLQSRAEQACRPGNATQDTR